MSAMVVQRAENKKILQMPIEAQKDKIA